jgi:flagellar motor switch protein FliN/FliY
MRDNVAEAQDAGAVPEGLDRILEIPLELTVELGRKRIRIGELLSVGVGSVIDLGTAAGAPLAIYANNTLIAHGEAVVVGERYGIRLTDIVSPRERVRRLGGEGP